MVPVYYPWSFQVGVSAPGGVCVSCGGPMQWTVFRGEMWIRCRRCFDMFGTDLADQVTDDEAVRRDVDSAELPF